MIFFFFSTTDEASLPWEQQLAVAHCEQVTALYSARKPPWPAHRVCQLDSQRQSWEACEPRLCRRLSQEALYLTAGGKEQSEQQKNCNYHHFFQYSSLGLMASRGTCTLFSEMSVVRPGLLWRGGWLGDKKWNSGLPGAEPRSRALAWDNAGEPGIVCWRREGEEGQFCLDTRAGTAAGILKPHPPVVIWLDKLEKIPHDGSPMATEIFRVNAIVNPCGGHSTCRDLKSPSDLADFVKWWQQWGAG